MHAPFHDSPSLTAPIPARSPTTMRDPVVRSRSASDIRELTVQTNGPATDTDTAANIAHAPSNSPVSWPVVEEDTSFPFHQYLSHLQPIDQHRFNHWCNIRRLYELQSQCYRQYGVYLPLDIQSHTNIDHVTSEDETIIGITTITSTVMPHGVATTTTVTSYNQYQLDISHTLDDTGAETDADSKFVLPPSPPLFSMNNTTNKYGKFVPPQPFSYDFDYPQHPFSFPPLIVVQALPKEILVVKPELQQSPGQYHNSRRLDTGIAVGEDDSSDSEQNCLDDQRDDNDSDVDTQDAETSRLVSHLLSNLSFHEDITRTDELCNANFSLNASDDDEDDRLWLNQSLLHTSGVSISDTSGLKTAPSTQSGSSLFFTSIRL